MNIILKVLGYFLIWTAAAFSGNWLAKRHTCKRYEKACAAWENILEAEKFERVIHCKDCEHFAEYTDKYKEKSGYDGACGLLAGFTAGDRDARKFFDYCSAAEVVKCEVQEDD